MKRVLLILVLGVLLLGACGSPTTAPPAEEVSTNWATYRNPTYGYTIDYPRDWDLDTSEAPEDVSIYPPTTALAAVTIMVFEGSLPIDTRTGLFQDSYLASWENSKVISSRSLEGKWQWIIEFTYTFEGVHLRGEAYFGETLDYQYDVTWEGQVGWASACKEVAETFVAH